MSDYILILSEEVYAALDNSILAMDARPVDPEALAIIEHLLSGEACDQFKENED